MNAKQTQRYGDRLARFQVKAREYQAGLPPYRTYHDPGRLFHDEWRMLWHGLADRTGEKR